uniref:Uncharacterized protein n=1 Tax=Plectus sambesii TaxID=2011161 RepID=A0A914VLY8_9BILA
MSAYLIILSTVLFAARLTSSDDITAADSLSEAALIEAIECISLYPQQKHYRSFSEWINFHNRSNIASIIPSEHTLHLVENYQLQHGDKLTKSAVGDCTTTFDKEIISVDTPLKERALCPFHYTINYNPLRVPAALTQVKCSCDEARHRTIASKIECEPYHYDIRVLLFDTSCQSFVETTESIALACLPVLQPSAAASVGESSLTWPLKARPEV